MLFKGLPIPKVRFEVRRALGLYRAAVSEYTHRKYSRLMKIPVFKTFVRLVSGREDFITFLKEDPMMREYLQIYIEHIAVITE